MKNFFPPCGKLQPIPHPRPRVNPTPLQLQPYPEYKDSGLPWLGKVPGHWGVRRMKSLFKERVQKGFPDEPLLAATQSKGVVRKEDYETRTVTAMKDFHLLKLVETGDFVISLRSFQGGIEVSHCRGIISPAYTVLEPRREAGAGYYSRFFKSPDFISSLTLFVTGIREGQNIDYERLSRAFMPLPPAEEQAAIGKFLDWANGRLERAIRAKRKIIALLNEQKQAIIHRAVTRGLNPNVKLKPSGIPWLGDIPEHWEVRKLRQLLTRVTERNRSDLPLLSVVREKGVIQRDTEDLEGNHNFIPDDLSNYKVVRVGQFAMNKMKAWQGSYGVSQFDGIVSPAYFIFKLRGVGGEFFHIALRSKAYVPFFTQASDGVRVGQWDLAESRMKEISFFFPPDDEQLAIVQHVKDHTVDISAVIGRLEREIALLREYRTRLVADVVTGKLDVREAAKDLPDETVAPEATPDAEELSESDPEEVEA